MKFFCFNYKKNSHNLYFYRINNFICHLNCTLLTYNLIRSDLLYQLLEQKISIDTIVLNNSRLNLKLFLLIILRIIKNKSVSNSIVTYKNHKS